MTSLFSRNKKIPVDVDELRNKGLQAAKIGDLNSAIKSWTSVISVQSDNTEIHLLLAASLQALHNVDSSAKHYRLVIKLQPQNIEAHLNLAMLLSTYEIKKMIRFLVQNNINFLLEVIMETELLDEAVVAVQEVAVSGAEVVSIMDIMLESRPSLG